MLMDKSDCTPMINGLLSPKCPSVSSARRATDEAGCWGMKLPDQTPLEKIIAFVGLMTDGTAPVTLRLTAPRKPVARLLKASKAEMVTLKGRLTYCVPPIVLQAK